MRSLNNISYAIVGVAMEVHRLLGPSLLESENEACLDELKKQGFQVERQMPIPVVYDEVQLECG